MSKSESTRGTVRKLHEKSGQITVPHWLRERYDCSKYRFVDRDGTIELIPEDE